MLDERLVVRLMRRDEAGRVAEITRTCPEAAQWAASDYAKLAHKSEVWDGIGGCALVVEAGGQVIAFLAVRAVAQELEVLNLAVLAAHRKTGAGSSLLETAFEAGALAGARVAFCEVRESNSVARSFYAKHGFSHVGRRLHYYKDPVEDALVLAKSLEPRK